MKVAVIGHGPLGRALVAGFSRAGVAVAHRASGAAAKDHGADVPDVILLAVRDGAIAEVAARLAAGGAPPILIHCAGALTPEEPFAGLAARPRGVALMHPLVSLAGAPSDTLEGVAFAVAGDAAGRAAALELVARLGGVPFELPLAPEAQARYHAAAALVSNHAVALVDAGVELLAAVGLEPARATRALAALLGSTARNLDQVGLPQALTGPIARGDAQVVERHLRALAELPELDALYRATARRVTKVAAQKGAADPAALDRIRALVGDGD